MKNKILAFISVFMLAFTVFAINFGVGAVTYTDISSASTWNNLASQTSVSGNYRLTANISVSSPIKSFNGTFEGGGYTITFSGTGTVSGSSATTLSPFVQVTGTTTINNLKTKNSTSTTVSYFGGIVAYTASKSNVTITNCGFTANYDGIGSTAAGGIVGYSNGYLTVKNCDVSISSGYAIRGCFVGGVLGRGNSYSTSIIGCSVKGNKICGVSSSGAISLGGIVGYDDNSSSVLFKNLVNLDNFGLTYPGNGAISCQGAGFLAGHHIGYIAGNFAYIKNITDYVGYTAYLVGTSSTYASIFNNACETNNSSISKEFYGTGPATQNSNYMVKGLSGIQITSTSYIYPLQYGYYNSYNIEWKGRIFLMLNYTINEASIGVDAKGEGERYFNSGLTSYFTASSTTQNNYHFTQLGLFIDSERTNNYRYINTISGTEVDLKDYVPTRNHYTFSNWRTTSNSTAITTYTMSHSYTYEYIYAAWSAEKKTFYFDVDGVEYKNRTATYDSAMNLSSTTTSLNVPNPTKENYEFVRWEYVNGNKTYTPNSSNVIAKADINELFDINGTIRFNAVFNKTGENVSVNLNGGSLSGSFASKLTKDSAYSIPSSKPTKAGCEFTNYTVSNGTKTLTVSNGSTISVSDVNEFVAANTAVTITANYTKNSLTITYSNLLIGCPLDDSTIDYDGSYVFPNYPYSTLARYFGGYKVIYNDTEYVFMPGDNLPEEIIQGLSYDSSNTLNVSLIWINRTIYDNSYTLNSLDVNGFEFNSASVVEVNKTYNGYNYHYGIEVNNGEEFTYNSDKYYDAYFVTNEDNASLTINGITYVAENGIINVKINKGENTFVANTNTTLVYLGLNELNVNIDLKCQYDTANPSNATKIRFIAIIDNIEDVSELESGYFYITIKGIEKEFEIKNIYSGIQSLNNNYGPTSGRYYAVLTIYGIEDAISNGDYVENVSFELNDINEHTYSCSHDGFTLGE